MATGTRPGDAAPATRAWQTRGLTPASSAVAAPRAPAATNPTLRGPYVDLTTGKGNLLTLARMNSNFDESKVQYGSASATVFGVRPGEAIRALFGAEVVSSARAWKPPDGSDRVLHRETVLYTDLRSGEVLSEFGNPYTSETVRLVDVVNDHWNETSLIYSGTWSRTTPWLPWMLMGQAPGHCWYESTMQGFDTMAGFKPQILAYMKKAHTEMLVPPPKASWSKPKLSRLEIHARDQKAAPLKL